MINSAIPDYPSQAIRKDWVEQIPKSIKAISEKRGETDLRYLNPRYEQHVNLYHRREEETLFDLVER